MAWEGAIAVSAARETGCVGSSRFLSYRAIGDVNLAYLNYFFQSESGKSRIVGASTGTVLRNQTLSPKNFEALEISLPAVGEQHRIAAKLDKVMPKAQNITINVPDEKQSQTLLTTGLSKLLERFADGTGAVGDVCAIVNDLVRPGEDPSPASEFVGLEHIAGHYGVRTGARPVGEETGRKFRFAPGDILYGYLRPYLNKVWVADRHGLCSVEQYVLRPVDGYPAELLAHILRSQVVLDQVIASTNNLQLPRLRSGLLLALRIPLIPEQRHSEAIRRMKLYSEHIHDYAMLQRHRNYLARALRKSLVNAAFSGEL